MTATESLHTKHWYAMKATAVRVVIRYVTVYSQLYWYTWYVSGTAAPVGERAYQVYTSYYEWYVKNITPADAAEYAKPNHLSRQSRTAPDHAPSPAPFFLDDCCALLHYYCCRVHSRTAHVTPKKNYLVLQKHLAINPLTMAALRAPCVPCPFGEFLKPLTLCHTPPPTRPNPKAPPTSPTMR